MTFLEQLDSWQQGKPIHNDEADECCPDFSCCRPELLAPPDIRDMFVAAYQSGREEVWMRMLMTFLEKAVSAKRVYIAGLETSKLELEEKPNGTP